MYRALHYVEYQAGESIFKYGDEGDLFYIIISGEVEVKTPAPESLSGDESSPANLTLYLVRHFEDLDWEHFKFGNKARDILVKELIRLKVPVSEDNSFEIEAAEEAIVKAIQTNFTCVHELIYRLLNCHLNGVISTRRFQVVSRIKTGGSFGELALFNNKGRAATITCSKFTRLATLSGADYIESLGTAKKRQLGQICKYM